MSLKLEGESCVNSLYLFLILGCFSLLLIWSLSCGLWLLKHLMATSPQDDLKWSFFFFFYTVYIGWEPFVSKVWLALSPLKRPLNIFLPCSPHYRNEMSFMAAQPIDTWLTRGLCGYDTSGRKMRRFLETQICTEVCVWSRGREFQHLGQSTNYLMNAQTASVATKVF